MGFNPKYQFKGDVTADVTAQGAMRAPQLSGTISANAVEVSGGEIKQPFPSHRSRSIWLRTLFVQTRSSRNPAQHGSNVMFALSQYTSKNMKADATLKTDGANIAELLNIAKAYGIDAAEGVSGTGRLSLNVHVQGPVSETDKLIYNGTGKSVAHAYDAVTDQAGRCQKRRYSFRSKRSLAGQLGCVARFHYAARETKREELRCSRLAVQFVG